MRILQWIAGGLAVVFLVMAALACWVYFEACGNAHGMC